MRELRLLLFCLVVVSAFAGITSLEAAPINYDESVDGDLDQGNPPSFILDAGDNVWTGNMTPTPTANTADVFQAVLLEGFEITHIRWQYGPNDGDVGTFSISGPDPNDFGNVVNHNNIGGAQDILDSGWDSINPNLPLTVTGTFTVNQNVGFAIGATSWTVTLTVTGAPVGGNTAPTDIALSNNSVDENQPAGTAVGTLSTTDADAGDSHTYALVAGAGDTDNASFAIAGDQLQTAASFDAETQGPFSVRVQTTDSGGLTFEKSFAVTVNGVNEAPTDIALSNNSVDENQPAGTAVGNLSTTDADAGDSHTYVLVAGAGDTDNASFAIAGNQLQTAASFDAETQGPFSVRVQTTDSGGLTFEKSFAVTVNNVNEGPTADAGPDHVIVLGEAITFDGSGSTDPENNIDTYDWDFGDTNTDSGISVQHTYGAAGMYTATLVVTDLGGLTDTDAALVEVKTASDATEDVIDYINNDLTINDGLKNSLIVKLVNVITRIENARKRPALNQLQAFINQVEDLRGDKLTDAEADFLVNAAQTIIESINFSCPPAAPGSTNDRITIGDVELPMEQLPRFRLAQNYPNPFRSNTAIQFDLPEADHVTVKIYDVRGREVTTLLDSWQNQGPHSVNFNAEGLPRGVYFYRLDAGAHSETRRLIIAQ